MTNLKCHDNWQVGKLVLGRVIVALGGVGEVFGYQILDAYDVADGGKFTGFLCLCCVTAVGPVFIQGQHGCFGEDYNNGYQTG